MISEFIPGCLYKTKKKLVAWDVVPTDQIVLQHGYGIDIETILLFLEKSIMSYGIEEKLFLHNNKIVVLDDKVITRSVNEYFELIE